LQGCSQNEFSRSRMKSRIPLSLLLLLLTASLAFAQKPVGKYYVIANAGLNLRAAAASTSEKLATAQYAEEVEITTPATAASSQEVDGVKGAMAKVKYKGKEGYMFDGFLISFPPPTKGEKVEDYAGRLWAADLDVLHEEVRRDWGGYAQMTYAIYFKTISWSEAFLVAKNLFSIPGPLHFPGLTGKEIKTVKNPNADANAWTDQMEGHYDGSGKLIRINYSLRGEGGGSVITVEPGTDDYAIKISELDIAD
jgi:hypothetical protein